MASKYSILFLVHEALSGNKQAVDELNDLFEENNLRRKDIQTEILCDLSEADINEYDKMAYYKVIHVFEKLTNIGSNITSLTKVIHSESDVAIIEDSNKLGDLYNINYNVDLEDNEGVEDWLVRANLWLEACQKLGFAIPRTNSPTDWGFKQEHRNIPGFTEFFSKVCLSPSEEWFQE